MPLVKIIRKTFGAFEQSDARFEGMLPTLKLFLKEQFGVDARRITSRKGIKIKLNATFKEADSYWNWTNKADSLWYSIQARDSIQSDELHYVDEDFFPYLDVLYFLQREACDFYELSDDYRIQGTELVIDVLQSKKEGALPNPNDQGAIAAFCARALAQAYVDGSINLELNASPIYQYIEDMFGEDRWEMPGLGDAAEGVSSAVIWDSNVLTNQPITSSSGDWSPTNWKTQRLDANSKLRSGTWARYKVLTHRQWVKHIFRGSFEYTTP